MRLFLFQVFRGFGPGRRVPFVSAKGTKTIAAPAGFLGGRDANPVKSGPTRGAQTRAARCEERPSRGPAGRRRINEQLVDWCVGQGGGFAGGG